MPDLHRSERTRVAVFRHTLYQSSERFIIDQARALPASVTMVARDHIINAVGSMRELTIADAGRSHVYRHMVGDHRPLMQLLRRADAQVIHAHFGVEGMYSRAAARALDIPHVTTIHGFDATLTTSALLRSRNVSWVRYAAQRRRFFRSSEGPLVAVSSYVRRRLLESGAPEANVFVIGTGVDTRAILPAPLPDTPTILHVARLVEKKGTEYLIRALPRVRRRIPDVTLRIVGDGPLRGYLERLSAELGVKSAVTFIGSAPHALVLEELRGCRVFSLPSVTSTTGDAEGLGQVLLEAGAIGRPVVATPNGGIPDAVRDGDTGLLVPERDHHLLADALTHILQDQASAERMAVAGRVSVSDRFDLHRQADVLNDLYRRLLHD